MKPDAEADAKLTRQDLFYGWHSYRPDYAMRVQDEPWYRNWSRRFVAFLRKRLR